MTTNIGYSPEIGHLVEVDDAPNQLWTVTAVDGTAISLVDEDDQTWTSDTAKITGAWLEIEGEYELKHLFGAA